MVVEVEDHRSVGLEEEPPGQLIAVQPAVSSIDSTPHNSDNHHKLRRDPGHRRHNIGRTGRCNLSDLRLQVDLAEVVEREQQLLGTAGLRIHCIHCQRLHSLDDLLDSLQPHNPFAEEGSL